jgi:hypothetical protein
VGPDGANVYAASPFSDAVLAFARGTDGRLGQLPDDAACSSLGRSWVRHWYRPQRQCKSGGWRNFRRFKNQGQCIAFVNHHG